MPARNSKKSANSSPTAAGEAQQRHHNQAPIFPTTAQQHFTAFEGGTLRNRRPELKGRMREEGMGADGRPCDEDEVRPLLSVAGAVDADADATMKNMKKRKEKKNKKNEKGWMASSGWLGLAVASGTCAAFNGAFAKLATTELTASLAEWIARAMGVGAVGHVVELIVRGTFFGLNIIFNGVMWTLFTAALSRGTSTTQVSIVNTSTNFVATALLGLVVFSETLPPLWWLGAAMLVAGNVIIGSGKEGEGEEQEEGEEEEGEENKDEPRLDLHDAPPTEEGHRGHVVDGDHVLRSDGLIGR